MNFIQFSLTIFRMSYDPHKIEEIHSKSRKRPNWQVVQEETQKPEQQGKKSKLLPLVMTIAAFIAFILAILIALGLAFGISLLAPGLGAAGTAAISSIGALAMTAGAMKLAATIRGIGKEYSETMSKDYHHQKQREWIPLKNFAQAEDFAS